VTLCDKDSLQPHPKKAQQLRTPQVHSEASMRNLILLAGLFSLGTGVSYAADQSAAATWTPSIEAPQGLLTPREVHLHDVFIDLARTASSCTGAVRQSCKPGGIDVVFFGSTFAEAWGWQNAGAPTWSERLASRKAANFGSQGSRPQSLLWRMRNGELDGYSAKLVVLWLPSNTARLSQSAFEAAYGPIISEIRARQPQARVLLFGTRPDQQASAGFVDNASVFYAAAPELRADSPEGYRARADQLEPWLRHFVD
jgi:hypothetical protein